MKTSSDAIGNRIGDLPDFSAAPQPTGPPRCTHNSSLQRTIRDSNLAVIELSLPAVHFLAFRRFVSRVSAMETRLVNIALTTTPSLPLLFLREIWPLLTVHGLVRYDTLHPGIHVGN